mgnify:CR=1 FL=1
MKISTLIIVLLSFTKFIYSQEIIFKPVFINQCTKEVSNEVFWWITDEDSIYYNNPNLDLIVLPLLGKYMIHFGNDEDSILIKIDQFGVRKDTFYTKRISLSHYVSNPPVSEYYDCENLANGRVSDYFYNGNLRLKGSFINGQPIDTLKKYYSSGLIRELFIPYKNSNQHIFFYENGNIKTDNNFKKKYKTEFYESGEKKMIEIWKSKINYKKVGYYRSGQKNLEENNKKQTKYFLNGTIKTHFTRKEVSKLRRILSNDKNRWFEYQCIIYDSLGNKIAYVKFKGDIFSDWNIFPENLSEINETQFETIIIFENNQISKTVDFNVEKRVFVRENIIKELNSLNEIILD